MLAVNRPLSGEETAGLIARNPFNYLAFTELQALGSIGTRAENEKWWNKIQHRIVTVLALFCLTWRERHGPKEELVRLAGYRRYAHKEATRCCREVVKPVNPIVAEQIVKEILEPLCP